MSYITGVTAGVCYTRGKPFSFDVYKYRFARVVGVSETGGLAYDSGTSRDLRSSVAFKTVFGRPRIRAIDDGQTSRPAEDACFFSFVLFVRIEVTLPLPRVRKSVIDPSRPGFFAFPFLIFAASRK